MKKLKAQKAMIEYKKGFMVKQRRNHQQTFELQYKFVEATGNLNGKKTASSW